MADSTQQTYNSVTGYFSDEESAETAVRDLREAGFSRDQISLAGQPASSDINAGTSTASKARTEGRKAGEAAGGFWERIRNFFEGDSPEAYSDERTRGELASHEITDTYDTDTYDYDPTEFHQTLTGSTEPDERSRYFSHQYARTGQGIMVIVRAGDRMQEAEQILKNNGADLGENSANYNYDESSATVAGSAGSSTGVGGSQRIQLYGETLRVHRDRVQRGEARLRKETVTETKSVEVPVSREELVIERSPVSGEQAAPGANIGQDQEIRIPLSEDRVTVDKEPVVREQVDVGKREVTNVESRKEDVRREELRVEDDDHLRKAS